MSSNVSSIRIITGRFRRCCLTRQIICMCKLFHVKVFHIVWVGRWAILHLGAIAAYDFTRKSRDIMINYNTSRPVTKVKFVPSRYLCRCLTPKKTATVLLCVYLSFLEMHKTGWSFCSYTASVATLRTTLLGKPRPPWRPKWRITTAWRQGRWVLTHTLEYGI